MSEDEYEQYLKWVQQAQSDLKEDEIVAGPVLVPTLISLAVGILFTAVGYLLTPKPKPLGSGDKQIRNKQGDSVTGRSRFNPTYGFDSSAELGVYGTPIPIHFGKVNDEQKRQNVLDQWPKKSGEELLCSPCVDFVPGPIRSGGMVVSPYLVWSRMYSMGRGQLFQGMYVVGERMNNEQPYYPDLAGIWLGNNTLDKVQEQNFAFYYDDEGNEGRIRKTDLTYGTHDDKASGNPFLAPRIGSYRSWAEAFPAPVCDKDESSGFCMTYSLSNQSTFGVYSPIMNGVDRRPPWRIISLPDSSDGDSEARIKQERQKISGGEDRMEPSGRGYGRLMGLYKFEGKTGGSEGDPRWEENVQRGDKVRFKIMKKRYDEDLFDEGVSVEDLVNESDADRQAADDALQIGEQFMIDASIFRVIDRSDDIYEMEEDSSWAELECVEDRKASSKIGFVSEDYFEQDICSEDASTSVFQDQHVPPHWSPLLKYEIASFRNIRKADVTEIGIKSRVWAQMNGMANFPTLPTSNELRDQFDKKNVQYANGVQSQYFTRFSFFTMYMRNIGEVSDPTNPSTFRDTNIIFAIRGNEPVDQYNYIRIKPAEATQYEYKLHPLSSSWAAKREEDPDEWDQTDVAWVLDAAKGEEFTLVKEVAGVGLIEIKSVGRLISIKCALTSPLMLGKRDDEYFGFCPPEYCEGFSGRFDGIDYDDIEDAIKGYDEDNEGLDDDDLCQDNPCAELRGQAARVRKQQIYWNYLASKEKGDPVPDYIKDGFAAECVDCSSAWDDKDDEDDAPQVGVMKGGCDTDYEEKSVGRPGSGNNPQIETGIDQVRIARGPGAAARVTEKWMWKGKTIWEGSTGENVGRPWKDERKDGGNVYKPGKSKIKKGGTTSGFFTWEIEKCPADGDGGGGGGDGDGDGDGDDNSQTCGDGKPYWAIWEYATQVNEGSYYSGLVSRSCDSGAEHQIVYINETVKPPKICEYPYITMMGLSLRATREFNNLDQPRLCLNAGIRVRNLQKNGDKWGPSNNYANLIYFLLTDKRAGVGEVVSNKMVDEERMIQTAKFIERMGLTWDGTISETTNLRTFASQTAPFFLCNFTVTNGKFTLWPAVPCNSDGEFKNQKVKVKQIFTEGNIIDGSFSLNYLDSDDRRQFKAVMRYRQMVENQLPEEKVLTAICYGGSKSDPSEEFDMTQFCTTPEHALLAARYFMWVRNVVTHTIKLQTVPEVMNGLGPGDFIKLKLEHATIQRTNVGSVSDDGRIKTAQEWDNGTYDVIYWIAGMEEPSTRQVTVENNRLINAPEMANAMISPRNSSSCSATESVYQVESVTLEEDGLVEIVASYYPVDATTNKADLYNWLFGLGPYEGG